MPLLEKIEIGKTYKTETGEVIKVIELGEQTCKLLLIQDVSGRDISKDNWILEGPSEGLALLLEDMGAVEVQL